jgi:hypothetical protein
LVSLRVPRSYGTHDFRGKKIPRCNSFHHRAAGGSWSVGIPTKWR